MKSSSFQDEIDKINLSLTLGQNSADPESQMKLGSLYGLGCRVPNNRGHQLYDFPLYGLKNLPWQFVGVSDAA